MRKSYSQIIIWVDLASNAQTYYLTTKTKYWAVSDFKFFLISGEWALYSSEAK